MFDYTDLLGQAAGIFSLEKVLGYGTVIFRVLAIIIAMFITGYLAKKIIKSFLRPEHFPGAWEDRRVLTIRGLIWSLVRYSLYFIGGVMVLSEFGVDTKSIIAGAGIIGLAVGFGAQNLVKDIISGFFILFEDQFSVGDYVTAAEITGTVEEMGLRVTKIREWTGSLNIIPNGEISKVTNFSRGGMGVIVEVDVAYEEDLDRAVAVLNEICRQITAENREVVVEEPSVLGVTNLGESGVTIQIFGKVQPMKQWKIARDLRKRIKEGFDKENIEIPYPRRLLLWNKEGEEKSEKIGAI